MSETYGDQIECPYCGYVNDESYEYGEDDDEYTCVSCERVSDLSVYMSFSYTASTRPSKREALKEEIDTSLSIRDSKERGGEEWLKWDAIMKKERAELAALEADA